MLQNGRAEFAFNLELAEAGTRSLRHQHVGRVRIAQAIAEWPMLEGCLLLARYRTGRFAAKSREAAVRSSRASSNVLPNSLHAVWT